MAEKHEYKLWLKRNANDVHSAQMLKKILLYSVGESAHKIHATKCGRHEELVAYKTAAAKRAETYFSDSKSEDIAQLSTSTSKL